VVDDVVDSLVGDRTGVGPGEFDGLLIAGPAGCEDAVAGLLEQGLPWPPGARVQPQAVDEYDGVRFVRHLGWPSVGPVHLVRLRANLNIRRST